MYSQVRPDIMSCSIYIIVIYCKKCMYSPISCMAFGIKLLLWPAQVSHTINQSLQDVRRIGSLSCISAICTKKIVKSLILCRWMDDLRFHVLFNSILVISGR